MILQDAEEQGENSVCVWIWTSRSNVSDSPMLDPYRPSLPLSLSIPLSFCLWRLSRRNVSIPKESKKEVALVSVRMCVCVFCLPVCIILCVAEWREKQWRRVFCIVCAGYSSCCWAINLFMQLQTKRVPIT